MNASLDHCKALASATTRAVRVARLRARRHGTDCACASLAIFRARALISAVERRVPVTMRRFAAGRLN